MLLLPLAARSAWTAKAVGGITCSSSDSGAASNEEVLLYVYDRRERCKAGLGEMLQALQPCKTAFVA